MSGGAVESSSGVGAFGKIRKHEEIDTEMEVNHDLEENGQRMQSPGPGGEENRAIGTGRGKEKSSKGHGHGSRRTKGNHSRGLNTKAVAVPRLPPQEMRSDEVEAGEEVNSKNELVDQEDGAGSLEDLLDGDMEPQVSQLLNQLSSQIHHRVQAKKQRLGQHFQAVFSIPARIMALQTEQRQERMKMLAEFKNAAGAITEKLNEIAQLQVKNEEKQGKMVVALNRENDDMKKLITECNELQRACFSKFSTADKNLSKQMEMEAAQDADINSKTVVLLQKKLLADGQKEGSDTLFQLHRFI